MASTEVLQALAARTAEKFGDAIAETIERGGELTLVLHREQLLRACRILRDDKDFGFEQLIDLCGVDYSAFGAESAQGVASGPRYAAVYHLLSVRNNRRLRLKVFLDDEMPMVESVVGIWNSANWFEREAFDLFGIVFEGHPDLRRILTDYGFIGHPFRKDFPVSGHVEMRYDAEKQRVVYQPVSIEPRVLVPRVIREKGFARG